MNKYRLIKFKTFNLASQPKMKRSPIILSSLLAKQWHHEKNGDLKLINENFRKSYKAWWKCEHGEDHEWKTTIAARIRGSGCPFCSGLKATSLNNLVINNPDLASEWHYEKNYPNRPEDFLSGSNVKVWWRCKTDNSHIWEALINSRNRGHGCPICSGLIATEKNNLLVNHPDTASEWHYEKNHPNRPEDFLSGSGKTFWWRCSQDNRHEYEARIAHRTREGSGCPICVNRKADATNALTSTHPNLVKEWHYQKNGKLQPSDVTAGSHKKVWWQCKSSIEHQWKTAVYQRAREGSNCPFCSNNSNSFWNLKSSIIQYSLSFV